MKIADLRTDYMRASLDESSVSPDPLRQFGRWLDEAVKAQMKEPNAMTLATAAADGRPSARIVLLKGFDARGFVFFTNYLSRKGHDLAGNAAAALLFFWPDLERQVRLEGAVTKAEPAESAAYFAERPRPSQLGAWASPQSEPIAGRAALEARLSSVVARYGESGAAVPCPPHWGGYRLLPDTIEFWQGRASRLHDRIRYRRSVGQPSGWAIDRLAP